MSSVSAAGSSAQIFAQIDKLNQLTAAAAEKQTDHAVKLVKLTVSQAVEDQRMETFGQALNKVV